MSNRKKPPSGPILIEAEHLTDERVLQSMHVVFRFCTLERLEAEGVHVDGDFLHCTLKNLDFYWGLFNGCALLQCRFERCRFRGTSFFGCRFVECSFVDCSFEQDNLGGDCSFSDSRWYDCTQSSCKGLAKHFAATA